MIKTVNHVHAYEINGAETDRRGEERANIAIAGDDLGRKAFVTLIVDGTKYTVKGSDLKAAISNAENINPYN